MISRCVFRRRRAGKLAKRWTILLTDADGRRREILGYTDRRATDQKAAALVRQLERREVGLFDPFEAARRQPIGVHLDAFLQALGAGLLGRGRRGGRPAQSYVDRARARLRRLLAALGARTLELLSTAEAAGAMVAGLRSGWSDKTRDDHAHLLRQFGAWLVTDGRLPVSPFAALRAVSTEASRTFRRHALSAGELQRLVEAAEVRPVAAARAARPTAGEDALEGLRRQGEERGLLYLVMAYAGLRRGEVCTLTWADLRLGGEPAVTVQAQHSKNRKQQTVALPGWLGGRLLDLRHARAAAEGAPPPPTALVFRSSYRQLLERLQQDALYAGIGSRGDRGRVVDDAGLVIDLHCLRGTYATMLAELGVPERVAMDLMRHSDVRLTFQTYAQVRGGAARQWVEQLVPPGVIGCNPQPQAWRQANGQA